MMKKGRIGMKKDFRWADDIEIMQIKITVNKKYTKIILNRIFDEKEMIQEDIELNEINSIFYIKRSSRKEICIEIIGDKSVIQIDLCAYPY